MLVWMLHAYLVGACISAYVIASPGLCFPLYSFAIFPFQLGLFHYSFVLSLVWMPQPFISVLCATIANAIYRNFSYFSSKHGICSRFPFVLAAGILSFRPLFSSFTFTLHLLLSNSSSLFLDNLLLAHAARFCLPFRPCFSCSPWS